MVNLTHWVLYEKKLHLKIFNEAYAKELKRVRRNYPIFIYDDYRYNGKTHIMESTVKVKPDPDCKFCGSKGIMQQNSDIIPFLIYNWLTSQ